MKRLVLFLVLLLFPLTAIAGEKVSGTNFFVVDNQGWETGDGTGYWIWHGEGVHYSAEGPLGTVPTECHGAGFWDGDWPEPEATKLTDAAEKAGEIHVYVGDDDALYKYDG